MVKKFLSMTVAAAMAATAVAGSFELVDKTLVTNNVEVILGQAAGDHVTIVNSSLTVTNALNVSDTTGVRRKPLYVGITNSTLVALTNMISFQAKSYTGNTTHVDVVDCVFTATNYPKSRLNLGVWGPSADWGEHVFFNARNSTFNFSGMRFQGALTANFKDCTFNFSDFIASDSTGFGSGSSSNPDLARVTFDNCSMTNWSCIFGAYKGPGLPGSVATVAGGKFALRNLNFNNGSAGLLVLTNGADVVVVRKDGDFTGSNILDFGGANGSTGVVEIVGNSRFQVYSKWANPSVRIASGGSGDKEFDSFVKVRVADGGVWDDAANGEKGLLFHLGAHGTGELHIEDGGVFKTYRLYFGLSAKNSGEPTKQRIYQTGGLLRTCINSGDNKYSLVILANANGHDSRYILDGGVLQTPQLYSGVGAKYKGGTGYAALSANGGTIKPGDNSTQYHLIHSLDLAECGPKGLTVDTADYTAGATINQEFTNKEGEKGLFRKVGPYKLAVSLPGRYDWDVSETRAEGGTLEIATADAVMKTAMVVTNGATLSMVGAAETLTLDSIAIPEGTLAVDPGDKIIVPADRLSLGDFRMTFSSTLASDADADVFVCTGELSAATLNKIVHAIASSRAAPDGYVCTASAEVVDGVTHVRLKVAPSGSPLSGSTVWDGANGSWDAGANWSAGVPTADVWAEFPSSSAVKTLSLPSDAVAGALRFSGDGYMLSGGTLDIASPQGSAVVSCEAGTNAIASAMTFEEVLAVTNAPGTKLVLSGGIVGGGIEKTGTGCLELGTENEFTGPVTLTGGRTVVQDARSLADDDGNVTSVALKAGVLEFGEGIGDDGDVDGRFTAEAETSTKAVAMVARTNATIKCVDVVRGGFIKAGPARLTMLVSGEERIGATSVHPKDLNYPSLYFVIGDDGVLPDNGSKNVNDAYYTGLSVYEGELVLKAEEGRSQPVVNARGANTTIGVHTDGASVTPALTIDGVFYDNTGRDFFASGYNIANTYREDKTMYTKVPSLFKGRLNLRNGAKVACSTFYGTRYGGGNNEIRPMMTVSNSTIRATSTYYLANNNDGGTSGWTATVTGAVATVRAKGSVFESPTYYADGRVDQCFDDCKIGPVKAGSYSKFTAGTTLFGTVRIRNGSVFRVGTLDFTTKFNKASPTRVFTLAFDDAEWQYGDGDYTLASTVLDANHATNFVIRMDGKGVVLKPKAGTTFTTELPFQGEGGIVVDGGGTVAFGLGAAKFTGPAEIKSGVVDLSAAGTVSKFSVKGPGTLYGGTLVNPRIVLDVDDEWGVSSVPTFDGCTISGRVTVDCGHEGGTALPLPMSTPVVVARFTGSVPDVSAWKLKGTGGRKAFGQFSVVGNMVVMTASYTGAMLIVR